MKAPWAAAFLVALATIAHAAEPPHVTLEQLDATVVDFTARKILNDGQQRSLRAKLGNALDALETGDRAATMQRVNTFLSEINALYKGKVLDDKEALYFMTTAQAVITQIDQVGISLVPIQPNFQMCPSPCKGKTEFSVDGNSTATKPDGSPASPFRTIAEAISYARALKVCRLELLIAPGRYVETVLADRDLILRGTGPGVVLEGSVINYGGYRLEVHSMILLNSPSPGGIVVFSCSTTTIRDVRIEGATGYGIRQMGGGLEMYGAVVRRTRAEATESSSGAGIRLTGVVGAIRLTTVDENSGGGMLIEGAGSRVYAGALTVRQNRMNPAFDEQVIEKLRTEGRILAGVAGVEVRQGLLLMEWFGIEHNQMLGLLVAEGARVGARYGVVSDSEHLEIPEGEFGAIGIMATDTKARSGLVVTANERAVLDLQFVSSLRNPLTGLNVSEVFARTQRGRVERNYFGLVTAYLNSRHTELPSYDLTYNCIDLRTVRDNEENSSFEFGFPVPVPCGLECPPLPPCRRVPFLCDWCG